jgi:hypothetical protein
MGEAAFRQYYEHLTDNELAQVLADKQDLIPEAACALDQEVQRRHFVLPESPQWTREPDSDVRVQSLEDYGEYQGLLRRNQTYRRYWYFVAIGPLCARAHPGEGRIGGISLPRNFQPCLGYVHRGLRWETEYASLELPMPSVLAAVWARR